MPYPLETDTPDVAADIHALATALDGVFGPVGAIMQYAAATDPASGTWLICNGRAISRTTYSSLFSTVSTTYGGGDGSTTFNIPDLRGRIAVGVDASGVHLGTAKPTLASSGGEENHTLSSTEMPSHSHGVTDPGHVHGLLEGQATLIQGTGAPQASVMIYEGSYFSLNTDTHTTGISINNAGSGGAHNNLQPYLALNYIIRVL